MSELVDHVMELLEPFGDVSARRMFGGHGLFRDGVMFALEADDVLYFKVDDETRPAFDKRELTPFEYARNGNSLTLSYRMAPEETLDNSKKMCSWAEDAYQAAIRTAKANKEAEAAEAAQNTTNLALTDGASADGGALATQLSAAEVAAKLLESRQKTEQAAPAASAAKGKLPEPGRIISAAKAVQVDRDHAAARAVGAKTRARPAASPKKKARTAASARNGTARRKPAAGTSRKAASVNGSKHRSTTAKTRSDSDDEPMRPLQKAVSRRAATILTRAMLGLSAAH